jgi:hypothetical protein
VPKVTSEQVCSPDTDRRKQYGPVFIGQLYGREEGATHNRGSGGSDFYGFEKLLQVFPLARTVQVSAGLFSRQDRGYHPHLRQPPPEPRIRAVGCRKEDVGIQKEHVNRGSMATLELVAQDGVRVEPHPANLLFGAGVVLFIHSVREQKLRFSL